MYIFYRLWKYLKIKKIKTILVTLLFISSPRIYIDMFSVTCEVTVVRITHSQGDRDVKARISMKYYREINEMKVYVL